MTRTHPAAGDVQVPRGRQLHNMERCGPAEDPSGKNSGLAQQQQRAKSLPRMTPLQQAEVDESRAAVDAPARSRSPSPAAPHSPHAVQDKSSPLSTADVATPSTADG